MSTRTWLLGAAALVVAAAFVGCEDEDAGPTALTGRAAIMVGLDFVARDLPGGDATAIAGLDLTNAGSDLLGRAAPSRDPVFVQSGDLDMDKTTAWIGPRVFFSDPRLPKLIEHVWNDTYGDNIDFLEFQRPDRSSRIDRWDYRSDLDYIGVDNSWYAVGLVRYATVVNGLIDHLEILANDGNTPEPDGLVVLGGSPAGYPDHQADWWLASGDDCPVVPAGANPFILGHFKTGPAVDPKDTGANFDGETDADFCFLGSGQWQASHTAPLHPDSVPFAPNSFEPFDLPQYNYLVIWEYDRATNTVLFDRPHMRAQLGVELDLNGNPIRHAFAPFPTAPGLELSEFTDFAEFVADPVVAVTVTAISLIANHLKPLASGSAYQIWLVDDVEREAARVSPVYTLQRPDTVGISDLGEPIIEWVNVADPQTAQSFDGALGLRHIIELSDSDLLAAGIELSQFTHVVFTVGGSADASPLEAPAPAWYRYTDQKGTRADLFDNDVFLTGSVEFGFIPELADKGIGWQPFGGGTVEFLNVEAFAVGLERLARPPLGYFYGVWLVNEEDGSTLELGEITTPPPDFASLLDADITTGAFVTGGEILAAAKFAVWAELGADFANFTHVRVTLEPKNGAPGVMSETVILEASVPKDLDKLPEERVAS